MQPGYRPENDPAFQLAELRREVQDLRSRFGWLIFVCIVTLGAVLWLVNVVYKVVAAFGGY